MKKLFIILAACTLMVSCKWWHETFSSPEKCAQWYCEEMLDALKDGDAAEFTELEKNAEKWFEGLNESDQERARKAIRTWRKLHAKEVERYDF